MNTLKKLQAMKANALAIVQSCDDEIDRLSKAEKPAVKQKRSKPSLGRAMAMAKNAQMYNC
jgi:hypothetical protein